MGNFTWTRKFFPKEVGVAFSLLAKQLKKDASWPMRKECILSQRAIQEAAVRCVRLARLDEIAALTGERPLEQVADASGYGWGGTAYQLAPGRLKLEVIGQWFGLFTPVQSAWHPRKQELYAHKEVSRQRRKRTGCIPARCWTDHAHAVRDAAAPEVDSTTIRWVTIIESDGSA